MAFLCFIRKKLKRLILPCPPDLITLFFCRTVIGLELLGEFAYREILKVLGN